MNLFRKMVSGFVRLFERAMVDDIRPKDAPKPEPLRFPSGCALRLRSVEEFNKIAYEADMEGRRVEWTKK